MSQLKIYRASAGSGKTFTLTLEYFRIIFSFPSDYKNILAVTFTNKATEEMKSRIINELHKLAEGEYSVYGRILKQELKLTDETLKNRAEVLRTQLLHDYGRIAVTTIDRFFQRIIKSFTKELGIFPAYNVELDSEFVLTKAVDKVMEQLKVNAELRRWVGELMEVSVDEGKSWSVKAKMAELGKELFKENYMLFDKQILYKFGDKNFLQDYRSFLKGIIREYEEELEKLSKEAVGLIEASGLQINHFKKNCPAFHFYKLQDGKLDEVTKTTREGVKLVEGWVTKSCDPVIRSKIEHIFPVLSSLLEKCIQKYDTQFYRYLSAKQLSDNLYQLGILNDLYRKVREYCEEKGLMLLSDTTHILNVLIEGNDTSFLFEKTGNYFKHIMIDEFQDTSSLQWKNFRPLITNSLGEGNRALIVGDVKQSIYRWRNGDWGLLAEGVEREFSRLGTKKVVLPDNWRSGREIVDFNNVFFERSARELKKLYDEEAGSPNAWSYAIEKAYDTPYQKVRSTYSGYVDIEFGPEKKEEKSDETIMDGLLSLIGDVLDRGGKLGNIVILVRNSKEGAFVADYLMKYNQSALREIHFISNDSLYVWSSPYVKFILSVLRYLTEPYDSVNRATLLFLYHTFLGPDKNPELDGVFQAVKETDLFQFLKTDFGRASGKIMSYSLFETIETIIEKFSLRNRREEVPYLIAFQDIVFEYEAVNSNSIPLFLEWWEKEREKKVLSTSEEVDAVRILTIHKSKGLEFDYVILPFCSWELDSVIPVRRIWCSNREDRFNALEVAPLNYSSRLSETIFKEAYYEEHLKAYVDNLNLLYVAFTRARKELYLRPYGPKFRKDGSAALSDMGAFIYRILSLLKTEADCPFKPEEGMQLHYGQKYRRKNTRQPEEMLHLADYPVGNLEDRISIKFQFKEYMEGEEKGLSALDEGKLLHEMFRSVVYADDVENAVRKAYLAGLISGKEKQVYGAKIQTYLSQSQAAEWFSPACQVINEREILLPFSARIRPDRIILRNGTLEVIDYKFGLREEVRYLKQVRLYCQAFREMGYPDVKGYIWYVKLNKIVEVN